MTDVCWTNKITDNIWYVAMDYGFSEITFTLLSGAATLNGNVSAAGENSSPIDLTENTSITIKAKQGAPIDGIVLDCLSGGVVQINAKL